MSDCLFCKIASGAIPAKEVYRDADVVAIEDINPQAPVHVLVIPVQHFANATALASAKSDILFAHILAVAAQLGDRLGNDGYRLAINTGPDGGQTVDHLHVHVLAGRRMGWPPG
jgi:histidine triad (HIT) family protein